MDPTFGNTGDGPSVQQVVEDLMGERIEALAAWIQELDGQVRATATAADENALKELRKALEAWTKRDPKFEERLVDRVDVLADRLATLSSAVNTTVAAHASSEGEIAALRRELEQEMAKLQATLHELRSQDLGRELQQLRAELSALPRRGSTGSGDSAELRDLVENLRERVDVLAKTVATTAAGLAGREGELAALRRALDDSSERVEQVVLSLGQRPHDGELRASVDEQATRLASATSQMQTSLVGLESRLTAIAEKQADTAVLSALERRVGQLDLGLAGVEPGMQALGARLDSVSSQLRQSLEGLESRLTTMAEKQADAAVLSALEHRVGQLDLGHAGVEPGMQALGARLESVSSALDDVRHVVESLPEPASAEEVESLVAPLQAQVDLLAARVVEAEAQLAEWLARETARTSKVEGGLAGVDARLREVDTRLMASSDELERARGAWEEERTSAREQLDAVISALAETASRSAVDSLSGEVSRRLAELEREQAALSTEITSVRETFLAEKERLEAELREVTAAPAPIAPSEDAKLRRLLTAFADRIDAMEREHSTIAEEAADATRAGLGELRPLVDGRLDELTARIASLEERLAPTLAPPSLPGDGRFRVELRALDLRMQHAEAAARENREAVLVQLERLASRVEWRLQRLEGEAKPEPEEAPDDEKLGEVVPIRGSVET